MSRGGAFIENEGLFQARSRPRDRRGPAPGSLCTRMDLRGIDPRKSAAWLLGRSQSLQARARETRMGAPFNSGTRE